MSTSNKETDIINIKQIIQIFVSNWFWFFISISFCLFLALLINRYSKNSYNSSTRILIQSEQKFHGLYLYYEELFYACLSQDIRVKVMDAN